jgi:predicted ATPase/DNA-binding XRE family transcriptional regulator
VTGKVTTGAPLGVLVKEARSRRGITQEELAQRAGLSVRGVRYLEQGLRRPYKDTIERIVDALGLSPEEGRELALAARPPAAESSGAAAQRSASPVPAPPGPLIGRERELAAIAELLLHDDVRVLTLTGPGGVGKTRLAIEAAAWAEPRFSGGVVWVPLAALVDSSLVPRAIGQAFGLVDADSRPLAERLALALRDRSPVLLLLDNFEHVAAAAALVADLVAACPRLKVLVTSRAALLLRSEREFPVAPLTPPDTTAPLSVVALAANACVDLFLRRAQAVKPDFALTEANAGAVAAICCRLEGLPLALELAAARVRVLAPKAMLPRLDHCLSFLTSGGPDLPVRQRAMRETIAWSHELLGPAEQTLFRRLAVFTGGCVLDGIEAVCGGTGGTVPDVLEAVEALQRCSLVCSAETADEEPRFGMLETVREYALEKLSESGEEEVVRGRHAAWSLAFVEEGAPRFFSAEQGRWLDRLEQEHGNVRTALRWFVERKDAENGLRLTAAVWTLWYVRGYADGRALLAALLGLPEAAAVGLPRATSLLAAGQLALWQGDDAAARASLEESLALHRALGADRGTAHALLSSGFVARVRQDYDRAHALLDEALSLSREIDERFITAAALHNLGMMAVDVRTDLTSGRRLLEESLATYRALGMPHFISLVSLSLGDLARVEGDHGTARALLSEALRTMVEMGGAPMLPSALDCVAHVAMDAGETTRAVQLAGAASRLRDVSGTRSYPLAARSRERWLATAKGALGEAAFDAAWAAGRAMPRHEAIDAALGPSLS